MKFCQKCGAQHDDNASFCSKCGEPFASAPATATQQTYAYQTVKTKSKKKLPLRKKILIGIAVFLLVGIIGSMGIEDTGDTKTTTESTTSTTAETTKAIDENVKALMDATGYKESVCKKIYNQLKKCGYESVGKLTEVNTTDTTKSYKVTGTYHGSGMIIASKEGLFYFSWGSDTLYDAEEPETVKNINDYAVTSSNLYSYMDAVENSILSVLKSPSTAEFPGHVWEADQWGVSTENGIITISSYVDAQNSFGAMIRSNFIAQFRISDGHGIYLEFDGQVYIDER